jgi:hypothetical protein
MSPEELQGMRQRQLAVIRFDYLFRSAWYSIAEDHGYRYDAWLGTASHGTIAIRSHLFANGV